MKGELRKIRYFRVVAEELHFRRAAERLNIAQPALSRAVMDLERELGFQLLERTNRRVTLTPAGAIFLDGSVTVIDALEGAATRARQASMGIAGELVIGYTDFAIAGVLPRILKAFSQHHPEIRLEPVHGVTRRQLDLLRAGKMDFGFVTGPIRQPELNRLTVQQETFVVVLSENHPLARRQSIAIAELADQPFILGSTADWKHYHDHLFSICEDAGFTPRVVQQAFNSEGIFGLVACEMGITIHSSCALNYIRRGLVVRPLADVERTLPTEAIWRSEGITSVQQRFADFLRETDPDDAGRGTQDRGQCRNY